MASYIFLESCLPFLSMNYFVWSRWWFNVALSMITLWVDCVKTVMTYNKGEIVFLRKNCVSTILEAALIPLVKWPAVQNSLGNFQLRSLTDWKRLSYMVSQWSLPKQKNYCLPSVVGAASKWCQSVITTTSITKDRTGSIRAWFWPALNLLFTWKNLAFRVNNYCTILGLVTKDLVGHPFSTMSIWNL